MSVKTLGSTLASTGKSMLSFGLNMANTMAVGIAIDWGIKKIYNLITPNERAIERGKEAQEAINDAYTGYNDQMQQLLSVSNQYSTKSENSTEGIDTQADSVKRLGETYGGKGIKNNPWKVPGRQDAESPGRGNRRYNRVGKTERKKSYKSP